LKTKKELCKEDAMKKAVIYCRDHDILKEFLEKNSSEVMNMLLTEWNFDDAKQVWFEEGMEKGRVSEQKEIARNALAEGASIEFVQKITGLDMDTIKSLQTAP
jgi:predicted transposase YdaD